MKKILLLALLLISCMSFGQTANDWYNKAQNSIERMGPSHVAKEYINKALALDSTNVDYRWVRVRCNMISSSKEAEWKQAIKDLSYLISKGDNTDKVYGSLALSHQELGSFLYYESYLPEGSQEQNNAFKQAVNHYQLAISAYKKAADLAPDKKVSIGYKIKDAEKYVNEINSKLTK